MNNEPIKITDLKSLQQEKQRLKMYCSYQETLIKEKVTSIKYNYGQIISEKLLPFSTGMNKKISRLLDWLNEFVLGKILKINTENGNNHTASLIKIIEVAIIRLFK